MLPMIQREIVETRKWATEEEIMNYYAVGQCTPGVIAVNTATFVGYKIKGISGGIAATLGVIAPSILIITLISAFIQGFADLPAVAHAFAGIRACVCVLIFNSVLKLGKKSLVNKVAIGIFCVILALSLFTDITPAFLVVLAGIFGLFYGKMGGKQA